MEVQKLRAELHALQEVLNELPRGKRFEEAQIKKRVAEIEATLQLLEPVETGS